VEGGKARKEGRKEGRKDTKEVRKTNIVRTREKESKVKITKERKVK
jgi:hypothetical protein